MCFEYIILYVLESCAFILKIHYIIVVLWGGKRACQYIELGPAKALSGWLRPTGGSPNKTMKYPICFLFLNI